MAQEQLAKKEAARIAAGKEKPVLKSAVVIDVKPWEAETDLVKMEELVRSVTMEGLEWKAGNKNTTYIFLLYSQTCRYWIWSEKTPNLLPYCRRMS